MTKDFTHILDPVLDDHGIRSLTIFPYVAELQLYLEEKTFDNGLYFKVERVIYERVPRIYAYIELEEVPRAFGESIIYPWVLKWNARHRPEAQNPEVSYGTMNNMTIYLWLTKQEEDILLGERTDVVCDWNDSDGWPEEYKAPEGLRAPLIDMARLTRLKVK